MSGMEIPAMMAIGSSVVSAGTSIYGATTASEASSSSGAAQLAAGEAAAESAREAAAVNAASYREQAIEARETAAVRVKAAYEQADAYEFEGRSYDRQATRTRSAGNVDETSRRDDLTSSLETITVMRAGRGLDLGSPTGRAIMAGVTEDAERDIQTSKTNYILSGLDSQLQGELSRRKSRYQVMVGESEFAAGERSYASGQRLATAAERAGEASANAALLSAAAGASAAESNATSSIVSGIGKVASTGLGLASTLKGGIGSSAFTSASSGAIY